MTQQLRKTLLQQAETLPPDEMLELAGQLIDRAKERIPKTQPRQDCSESADDSKAVDEMEYDPITSLIGSLHLETQDLAEHHDLYIGNALYQEMKGEK